MLLIVNKNSKKTVFDQIFSQITELINNGTLNAGARLPSTRELSETIGVNRTTVIRVYEELWAQGFIESTPGAYTTVRKRQPIIFMKEEDIKGSKLKTNIYRDHLDLPYDPMMHYLENGEMIEKGKINFLQLSPDIRLLDRKQIKVCMRDAINETETNPFDFAHARGYQPLRQEIVKHMKLHNIYAEDKNILVTNGSLQSLQLIFQVFSKPGDYIAVENPTYSIILLFIKIFQLKIIEIPVSGEGMDLNVLKKVLKKTPVRFIYTMPTYQNPTGISMPQNKREELLNICEDQDCIIIEDSIEEEMSYFGQAHLPVKSIDRKGQVIYLGSFAKVLAPGLRIGWIIGSMECIKKLTVLKSVFEISSGTINQMFLYKFFNNGAFELHLRKTMRVFRKRMKVAINAIKKYIPAEKIEWTEPTGGYMIWLKLLTVPMENIENHFSKHGVMIHNGKYFFIKEQPCNYIRICISQTNECEIEEGIKSIGNAIKALNKDKS
jgi:DNA-binding transcriptional MocR family regulator